MHTCYRTAKGSEISVYCRVCTKPSSPPYLKKGMLPCLQGTIKLKAVSRLWQNTSYARTLSLSRETRLKAHLCYPINPSVPTGSPDCQEHFTLACYGTAVLMMITFCQYSNILLDQLIKEPKDTRQQLQL